jgi:hypothetical protein
MSLKKVKKKVDKIQRTIELLDGDVSTIERDLLLVYIRDLYEEVLDLKDEKVPVRRSEPSEDFFPEEEKKPEPLPQQKSTADQNKSKVEEKQVVSAPEPEEAPIEVNEELMSLFEIKEAEDLGDKLSKLPIKDLTKAMSINERIFTINELFGGDHVLFAKTVDHLNGLSNYEQAVDYLLKGVAEKHDWEDPQHLKKAEQFIHLVQRRFR